MRTLSIHVVENIVFIDGKAAEVKGCLDYFPQGASALQWDGKLQKGWIEFQDKFGEHTPNEPIKSVEKYKPLLDQWAEAMDYQVEKELEHMRIVAEHLREGARIDRNSIHSMEQEEMDEGKEKIIEKVLTDCKEREDEAETIEKEAEKLLEQHRKTQEQKRASVSVL